MEVFKAISKIKYKDNIFCVLINKTCGIYYIKELEDGSIMYPTEDEYIELTNILSKKQELAFFKIGKNYRLDPKVIMRTGKLLALGTAVAIISLTTTACTQKEVPPAYEETIQRTAEDIYKDLGYKFHSLSGYEDDRMYRIETLNDTMAEKRLVECQNFDEFSKYIDTKANPTYEELRETLKNNENVSEKYKEWIFEGINNLEKSMPDLNLTVLNYNFDRLKIIEKSLEDLNSDYDRTIFVGVFDQETGVAYFNADNSDDENKFIVYHEVLGHGVSEASFEKTVDETIKYSEDIVREIHTEKITISDSMLLLKINEVENKDPETGEIILKEQIDYLILGQGLEEGKADKIAKIAMNCEAIKGHPYVEQSEQLRIICEAVGLDIEDYISQGGTEILNQKMQENDVENSLMYINANDIFVSAMKSEEIKNIDENVTFKENVLAFFKDYADNKIKAGVGREEIVKQFSQILANGGDYIHSTFTSEEIYYDEFAKEIDEKSKEIERDD